MLRVRRQMLAGVERERTDEKLVGKREEEREFGESKYKKW